MREETGRALLKIGIAGGTIGALAAAAMFLRPGPAAGAAVTAADALILVGVFSLWRRLRGVLWLLALVGFGFSLLTTGVLAALPTVSVGPIFDVLGRLSWLGDAAAYGLLGVALIRRKGEGRTGLGIAAAVGCLSRSAAALLLAGRPSLGDQVVNLVHPWQGTAIATGVLLAAIFASGLAPTGMRQ
jgi:hypothetical protein